ncbi:MAG: trypsin-like peptidase domain-containing protein [Tissierellales bacterium]|nr:trypsin-like peptidase domain-containing protein [Tissierellales bacterium]MBN2827803.1 trypsin-like peptidase domain-containing protein [Tissierellales bacterium]
MDLYEHNDNQQSKKGYFWTGFAGVLVGMMIGAGGLYYYLGQVPDTSMKESELTPHEISINTSDDIYFAAAVAEKSMDTVVGIITRETYENFLFGPQTYEGMGSGVIVDTEGYILTNSHVVADGAAESIVVKFVDGAELEGELLWNNKTLDLAVVKVNKEGLHAATFGDSDTLVIGEPVVAIGNPLSLELDRTVTTGIVSGLDRSIQIDEYTVMKPLIQTDASINPGNSGGPLFNAKGQLIGINTAKITSAEGLGFSIPINVARSIVEEIIAEGELSDVYIGIKGVELAIYESQLNVDLTAEYGVVVVEVLPGSPAEKAGLVSGDVIQKIDDTDIEDMGDIQRKLFQYKPGQEAKLEIFRNGDKTEIKVVFEKKPNDF